MTVSKLLFLRAKHTILYHVSGARILLIIFLLDQLASCYVPPIGTYRETREQEDGKGPSLSCFVCCSYQDCSTVASYPDTVDSSFQLLLIFFF